MASDVAFEKHGTLLLDIDTWKLHRRAYSSVWTKDEQAEFYDRVVALVKGTASPYVRGSGLFHVGEAVTITNECQDVTTRDA